jgi:uncharacterized protein YprB with RNaseH-like and TPR domain
MRHPDKLPTRVAHYTGKPPRTSPPPRCTLEAAMPGGYAVRVLERGNAFKIIIPVPAREGNDRVSTALAAAFHSPDTPTRHRLRTCCRESVPLEEVLFFDVETTGLGQTPLFLIGVMTWEREALVIRQFLAREYREEAAIIQLFLETAADKRLFITFNGKSFDLRYLQRRAEVHNISPVLHAHHFDLLHECRRIWRTQLPNCQLQTLEQQICGHPPREDDIPGEAIPATYQTFLLDGNATPIAQIMRHNAQDLVTMAELLTKLPPLEHEA